LLPNVRMSKKDFYCFDEYEVNFVRYFKQSLVNSRSYYCSAAGYEASSYRVKGLEAEQLIT
jgi:putative hemolysin